jgi:hypothetical protein
MAKGIFYYSITSRSTNPRLMKETFGKSLRLV